MKNKEPLNSVNEEAPCCVFQNKDSNRTEDNILCVNMRFYIINETLGNWCKKTILHVS